MLISGFPIGYPGVGISRGSKMRQKQQQQKQQVKASEWK
jgi:hypothetical protein